MPDKEKIEKLENELMPIVNKYIDEEKMSTEDVYGAIVGVAFRVVQASVPAPTVVSEQQNVLMGNLGEDNGS